MLAPLTALLVVQATLFHTIGSAIRRVAAVTAGVLAAVAVEALEDHLEEAQRRQDQLADLLSTDPAERPEGWRLRARSWPT